MACGVFHKASKGIWGKIKGVFGRIGGGIKKAANWIVGNKDKISKVVNTVGDTLGGKYADYAHKATDGLDKGVNIAQKFGIG